MSNAMENGAGIAANAISQASFVPMHTVDSRTDKFNGGPSPVGTSREGKMPEVEGRHQRRITVPAKYAEADLANVARNNSQQPSLSPSPCNASRPKRAHKPKQHFDEITEPSGSSRPSTAALHHGSHIDSSNNRRGGQESGQAPSFSSLGPPSAPLTLNLPLHPPPPPPLEGGPVPLDLSMHQILNQASNHNHFTYLTTDFISDPDPAPLVASTSHPSHSHRMTSLSSINHMGKSRERIPLSATATAALSSAMPVFAPDKIVKGKKARSSAPKRPAGAMTLKCLLDAGIIQPGARILTLEYKGAVTRADLNSEGQIKFNGVTFESPSAFSIYVKRLSNPTRKADDGWKAVKYEGKLLEHWKDEYLKRKYEMDPTSNPPPSRGKPDKSSSAAKKTNKKQLAGPIVGGTGAGAGVGEEEEEDDEETEDDEPPPHHSMMGQLGSRPNPSSYLYAGQMIRPVSRRAAGGGGEDEEEVEEEVGFFSDNLPGGINLVELHQFLSSNQGQGQGQGQGQPLTLGRQPQDLVEQQMRPGSSIPTSNQNTMPQLPAQNLNSHHHHLQQQQQQPNQIIQQQQQQLYPSQYSLLASSAVNGMILTRPLSSIQTVSEEQLAKRQKIRAEADAVSNANASSANPSLPPLLISTSHGIALESGGMAFSAGGLPSPLTSADQIHMVLHPNHSSNEGLQLGGSTMENLGPSSLSSQPHSHHHHGQLPPTSMTHITDSHVASHPSHVHHPTSLPKVPPLSASEQQQRIEEMLIMSGAGHTIEEEDDALHPHHHHQVRHHDSNEGNANSTLTGEAHPHPHHHHHNDGGPRDHHKTFTVASLGRDSMTMHVESVGPLSEEREASGMLLLGGNASRRGGHIGASEDGDDLLVGFM